MATRGKSIKITIESIDGCEKEKSTKINIEHRKMVNQGANTFVQLPGVAGHRKSLHGKFINCSD